MHKDFKIGLIVGIIAAAALTVWLSTRSRFSTESRALSNASLPPAATVPPAAPAPAVASHLPAASAYTPEIAKPPQQVQSPKNVQPARYYIVRKGDTLSAISARYYGSASQYPKIVAANKSILTNPDRLVPGTRLLIPQ
jgi:nucleoid-associated protein YgaU